MHTVLFHTAFAAEFRALPRAVRIDLAAAAKVLGERGPALGRPHVDTLNGSRHANMKELRFKSNGGVWRVAFAFDPTRNAVVLVAGDKSGVSEKRFYASLIATADSRYDDHLSDLKGAKP
ncbi:addiction module toxin RelE [Azospirillum sp. TSA2s]|uniref:type II toxin-antitoxin system RelE/ParE family toxin n=1 Tax=Azospirillum sp. TSA2s TaxID=709810 RepID=UPI0010AAC8B7|nr:type II toxin-antitoxin system RelE/ParE family toxin [Azospirillum sp. TSA2s]QCG97268.1 addiction module toxin RelE [Azospirillum sp. TSA2s]